MADAAGERRYATNDRREWECSIHCGHLRNHL